MLSPAILKVSFIEQLLTTSYAAYFLQAKYNGHDQVQHAQHFKTHSSTKTLKGENVSNVNACSTLKTNFRLFKTEIILSLSQRHNLEYFTGKQMFIFCLYINKYYFVLQSHKPVGMLCLHKSTNNCLNSENNAHVIDFSP